MIFEFLIAYSHAHDADILSVIRGCLGNVLEANLNEFDGESVECMVIPRLERWDEARADDESSRRVLFGFALDLPEETESLRLVVDEFLEALNAAPVVHLVKFDDPLIRADLARWADEIYALEMKLRRVLTLIYLHAYPEGDPHDLLREESVQPMAKEKPQAQQMQERAENQFFHLTFSQYVELNRRPEFKHAELLKLIREREAYDSFREELVRAPVEDEEDAELLAGLKERMDAIEAMRNCCAHSRRPSKKVIENYDNVRPLLDQLLESYLASWEWSEPDPEMPWDAAARGAVGHAMEHAEWDEDTRQITIFDADDDRMHWSANSKEELVEQLAEIAASAFYANAPRDDGEFVVHCDEWGVVHSALRDYEDRLDEFFDGDGCDG
jgi:hypothetical protein